MDYRRALMASLNRASEQPAAAWVRHATRITNDAITMRARSGRITAGDMLAIFPALPLYYTLSKPALRNVPSALLPPPAHTLTPSPSVGILAVFYCVSQLQSSDDGSVTTVYVVVLQLNVDVGVSAWGLYVNAGPGAEFGAALDNTQVTVISGGVSITSPDVTCTMLARPSGHAVMLRVLSTELSLNINASSARGPVIQHVNNPSLVATMLWSVVDGVVDNSATLQVNAAGAVQTFRTGVSWYEYKQVGCVPMSGFTRVLTSLAPAPRPTPGSLWMTVQTPGVQMRIVAPWRAGSLPTHCRGNVWSDGLTLQNVHMTLRVLQVYPDNTPHTIRMQWGKRVVLMTSSVTAPVQVQLLARYAFASPATVSISQEGESAVTGWGAIHSVLTDDTTATYIKNAGLPAWLDAANSPSSFTKLAVGLVTITVVLILVAVGLAVTSSLCHLPSWSSRHERVKVIPL
jgi:hypothetical protein